MIIAKHSLLSGDQEAFDAFISEWKISDNQADAFIRYLKLLQQSAARFNITTLTSTQDILTYHFSDSLELLRALPADKRQRCADVGSGGGFPGFPLKIMDSAAHWVLIEVIQKRVKFLEEVINHLSLQNVTVVSIDWRTFLRKAEYAVDCFCARASLQPDELLRVFKPSSAYKESTLVYWASQSYRPEENHKVFIRRNYEYRIGDKKRSLIFFGAPHI